MLFLQVWAEAGAVGAFILLIFGLLVIRSIRRSPQPVQTALFATFSSSAMISTTGYSAFAPWLSTSFALAAVFAALVTDMVGLGCRAQGDSSCDQTRRVVDPDVTLSR